VGSSRHAKPAVNRRLFLLGGGVGALAALTTLGVQLPKLLGPPPPRLFGVSLEGSGQSSLNQLPALNAALDRTIDIVNIYVAWGWEAPFPAASVTAIASTGAVPEITWEPWRPDHDNRTQPQYALDRLDDHSEYIDQFARDCARYAQPLYLRFGHEMNSDWYPWSVTTNGNDCSAYVTAYRRLHRRFQELGATNVRWVWCPNVIYRGRCDLITHSYPGDDVVDVVGLDGYNRGGQQPFNVFGPSLVLLRDIAPTKPTWVNEVGTAPAADDGSWITEFFTLMARDDVECVVWFEVNKPSTLDWRLLRSPSSAGAARKALSRWR